MSGVALVPGKSQLSDASGNPLAAGTVDVYLAGTTTRTNSWQDQALTVLNTNPIVLDGSGSCSMWLDGATLYKLVVKNATGAVQSHLGGDNISGASGSGSLISFLQSGTGAVSRTAQNKMREVEVNVRDYNVFAGGGVLDDTATIQKAIDYVFGLGGGWVCFSEGTYLAKNIVQKSGVNFRGKGGVVKTLGTAVIGERLFYTTANIDRVKFRDMIIDGNKGVVPGSPASGVPLIELSFGFTATRVEVADCELRNNGYIGFRCLSTANRIKVTGSTFYDVDGCCWLGLAAASNVRIYGNHFEEGLSEGVTVDLATGFSYSNFTIAGNTCLNKVSCVFTDGAISGLAITGNTVIGNSTSGPGIRVDSGDGLADGVTVSGNTVTGHSTGILLRGSNVTCTGNTVTTCRLEGVLSSASQATLSCNTITNVNRGAGTPNRSGIVSSGDDVTIEGNTITDTAGTPLHFSGIRVNAGSNVSVIGNRVRGWTDVGYYVDNSCVAVRLADNDARGGNTNPYFAEGNVDTVVTSCHNNTSDQAGAFNIASNASNIRAEDHVTFSNSGGGTGATLQTISGVSKARGRTITMVFAGISTISHGVGNIKTRTAADITTAAGSTYQAVSDGTNWLVLN